MSKQHFDIPDECENTIEHFKIHVDSAFESAQECMTVEDLDQAFHDINIAYCIMRNLEG